AEKLKTRIEGKSLDWEKLTQSPAQFCQSVIPFALKTREQFGEDSRYQFTASLGGLVYDVLSTLNAKSGVDLARTKRLIQDEYDLGLEGGKLGLKEGRHIKAL